MVMIRCFWIEPMPLAQQLLRRFTFSDRRRCAARPSWGCDATVLTGTIEVPVVWLDTDRGREHRIGGRGFIPTPEEILAERRWPTRCDYCAEDFQPADFWQQMANQFYTDGSRRWTMHGEDQPPAGAMWHSWWLDDIFPGPDGRSITVMTPGGPWDIDGRATNGGRPWTRTGNPPDLCVSPSINIEGEYHGWLGNGGAPAGWLKEC